MREAENMRKQGIYPTYIEAYKSNKFQKIVNRLLTPTERRTI